MKKNISNNLFFSIEWVYFRQDHCKLAKLEILNEEYHGFVCCTFRSFEIDCQSSLRLAEGFEEQFVEKCKE